MSDETPAEGTSAPLPTSEPAVPQKGGPKIGELPVGRRPRPHQCSRHCRHTCGDVGGVTQQGRNRGKPCKNLGGAGRADVRPGLWYLCKLHDPEAKPFRPENHPLDFEGLIGRHRKFVIAYCGAANANAAKAAKMAGYTFGTAAAHLMQHPRVKAAILKRFEELSAPGEELIARMTEDARLDVAGLFEFREIDDGAGGKVSLPYISLTPENLEKYGRQIKEIETDPMTGRVVRVKLTDAQAARRDLAKIRQLYTDGAVINIFDLQQLSDEELAKRLIAAANRLRGPGGIDRHATPAALPPGDPAPDVVDGEFEEIKDGDEEAVA